MITAQQLSDRLDGKKSGKGWIAKCPAHDDRKASLSINETPDGVVLLKCHAGCETQAVLEKLSLTFADLQPEREEKARIVAVYDYRDEKQQLRYQALRMQPKDFRVRRPDGAGGHIWNIGGVEALPYRLPQITQAIGLRQPVFIVEGEKDADSLGLIGLEATTNHGGAGKWQNALNRWFKDADVILLPDNDEPGRKHAADVAAKLQGIARRIRILELPGLPPKGDVSDWLQAGGTAETLLDLASAAPEYTVTTPALPDRPWTFVDGHRLHEIPRVSWLIPSLLPEQGLTLLYGPSGVGKSFFALHIAMLLSLQVPVMYVATEGERGYLQRTEAWKQFHRKPMGNLTFCMGIVALLDDVQLQLFIDDLRNYTPKLLVIDTMAITLLPGDENNTRDMQRFVLAAKRIQRELNTAVLLVHHTNKGGDQERGNISLRGACDTMIRLVKDDDVILVECAKTKDGISFPTKAIRLLPVQVSEEMSSSVIVAAELAPQRKEDRLTECQLKLLTALHETYPDGASPTELEAVTRIPYGQVTKIMKRLLHLGHVEQDGARLPYRLSDQGSALLLSQQQESISILDQDSTGSDNNLMRLHLPPHQQDKTPRLHQNRISEATMAAQADDLPGVSESKAHFEAVKPHGQTRLHRIEKTGSGGVSSADAAKHRSPFGKPLSEEPTNGRLIPPRKKYE